MELVSQEQPVCAIPPEKNDYLLLLQHSQEPNVKFICNKEEGGSWGLVGYAQ